MANCACCKGLGYVLGLGSMKKDCPVCDGAKFVPAKPVVIKVKRSRKPKVVEPCQTSEKSHSEDQHSTV